MAVFGGGAAFTFLLAGLAVDRQYLLWGVGAALLAAVGIVQLVTGIHVPAGYVVVSAALGVVVGLAGVDDDFPALYAAAALFAAAVVFVSKSRREMLVSFAVTFVGLLAMSVLQSHETGRALWADTAINGSVLIFGFGFAWAVNSFALAERDRAEAMYEALFDSAGDAVLIVNGAGIVVLANDRVATVFGIEATELVGRPVVFLVAPRERERCQAMLEEVLGRGGSSVRRTLAGVDAVGAELSLDVTATPMAVRSEAMAAFVIRDMTARVHAERRIRQLLDRYQDLYEGVPVGLYRTTPDGELVECNPALATILGFEAPEDAVGTNVDDLYVDPEERLQVLASIERGGPVSPFRLVRRDGRVIWAQSRARALRDADGSVVGFEGVLEDITNEIEAHRDVEASLRFRSGLVGSVAHALRTPLTGVLGFAAVLGDELEGSQAQTARLILEQARELAVTVDDFVTAARLDAESDMTVIVRTSPVRAILEDVAAMMEQMGLAPPSVEVDADLFAACDPLRLGQAIRMLLRHRLQLGAGSVVARASTVADRTVIEIVDDGPFAPEDAALGWFSDPRGGFGPVGPWAAGRLLDIMGGTVVEDSLDGLHRYRLTLPGGTEDGGDPDSAHQEAGETLGGDGHSHHPHRHQEGDVAEQAPIEHAEGEGAKDLDSVVQG